MHADVEERDMAAVRTVKKWLLGREIAHMIAATGMKQEDAGALLEIGQSTAPGSDRLRQVLRQRQPYRRAVHWALAR